MARSTRYARWLYELLFSVYFALLIVARECSAPSSIFLYRVQTPLRFLDRLFVHLLGRPVFLYDVPHFTYSSWWLLALILLVCLRVLGRVVLMRTILCYAAGATAVAGPLSHWFCWAGPLYVSPARWWLWLEMAIMVACTFLYMHRRWPTSAALSILVLLLHFGFCGLVLFGRTTWWEYPYEFAGTLLFPFCTSLAWGVYVKLAARSDPPAMSKGVEGTA
jgi:hypothetical protein